ncbi:lasso peptide biosynthesis B2 protein [Edaphobacter flagellatus]|uniref:lasso peptide biosynthesis B2 protein n=1 Tax=Edaphobacter flagellatus TaxID=1933044 RepID=UPI0021B26772|nr:lasso peptide biosynthesis B2 protein [Edaphobacter flagellatus]
MTRFVFESWVLLLYFEFVLRFRGFKTLHQTVRSAKVRPMTADALQSHIGLCHAIDQACVFYFKRVMCLQRSAATTLLLRRHGWSAEMVVGAQLLPFKSHAWVEIKGSVVNDRPYMPEIYQVLERC